MATPLSISLDDVTTSPVGGGLAPVPIDQVTVTTVEGQESEDEHKPWYTQINDAMASGFGGFNEALISAVNVPWQVGRETHQMIFGGDVNPLFPNYDADHHVTGANAIRNFYVWASSLGPQWGGDVDRGGIPYQIGEEVALNASTLAPAGWAANTTKYTWGILKPIIEYIRSNAKAAVLIDLGIALPQGTLAWWGRQTGGETGEELGRMAGAGSVALPYALYRTASALKLGTPFVKGWRGLGLTKGGREEITTKMLEGALTKEELAALKAGDYDVPSEGGPFTTGELLDAGGLTRLRDIILSKSDPSLGLERKALQEREAQLVAALEALVSDPSNRTEAQIFIKNLITNSVKKLKSLERRAIIDAQARINKIDPEQTPEVSSRIVRDELDKAWKAALKQQGIVWKEIGDGRFLTRAIIERAKRIVAETPRLTGEGGVASIPESILNIAGREAVIGPDGKVIKAATKSILNEVEPADEIAALSARFNEAISDAMTNGRFMEADQLGKIRDSIYDDIIPVIGDATGLEQARAFSRVLNDKFTRGSIGRVLGLKARGEVKVDPELTLQELITPGPQGKLALLALRRAERSTSVGGKDFPHSELPKGESAIDFPVQQYLINKFMLKAMGEGDGINAPNISMAAARNFVNNWPVLELYPDLRNQMLDARAAQKLIKRVTASTLQRTDSINNQTIASKVIGGEVGVRIDSIITGQTPNPVRATDELLRLAAKDPTGLATKGVKDALYDHIMNNIIRTTDDGREILNPRVANKFLNNGTNRIVIRKVFGEEGMRLLDAVNKGMMYQGRGKPLGALKGDKGSGATVGKEFIGNMGTVMGVRLLGKITKQPLLSAGVGKRYALMALEFVTSRPQDQIAALLQKALEDPDFARLLLVPMKRLSPEQAMSMYKYIIAKSAVNIQAGTNIDYNIGNYVQ